MIFDFEPHLLAAIGVSLVDVMVVAWLLYRVLLLIRGTRAQQVLVGLGLIVALFVAARLINLRTVSWLLENFLGSFLLILIILFQNDIRRGLSRVGRQSIFEFNRDRTEEDWVDQIVRAADAMAKDRIGALILIERGADLTALAEKGFAIDANLSAPLLIQLFTPPGPTHDGAAIIQEGRLSAAAVFLQLTHNPRIDNTIGTRHRAAMGATEEYDAVGIVVSEERGQISFVESGSLTRNLDGAMLKKVLRKHLGLIEKPKLNETTGRSDACQTSKSPTAAFMNRKG